MAVNWWNSHQNRQLQNALVLNGGFRLDVVSTRYWVDLDPPGRGHEQRKRCPCVVVSPDAMHQTDMAVVRPLTSRIRPWPFRLQVTCNGNANSIMVDQIRAVSLQRFDVFIEVLGANDIQRLKTLLLGCTRSSFLNRIDSADELARSLRRG